MMITGYPLKAAAMPAASASPQQLQPQCLASTSTADGDSHYCRFLWLINGPP
jgi:hypothetical protein